jgi:DnaK suppressor protein
MSRAFGGSDFAQDRGELATVDAVRQVAAAKERQKERAERRRRDGEQGVCEDCGSAIPPARLERLPDATRCVACQSRVDSRR